MKRTGGILAKGGDGADEDCNFGEPDGAALAKMFAKKRAERQAVVADGPVFQPGHQASRQKNDQEQKKFLHENECRKGGGVFRKIKERADKKTQSEVKKKDRKQVDCEAQAYTHLLAICGNRVERRLRILGGGRGLPAFVVDWTPGRFVVHE